MKIRIIDRLLCALCGLILLALAAALVTEAAFNIQLTTMLRNWIADQTAIHMAAVIGAAVVLALLGIYAVGMLFRRGSGKRGFVLQKTENGELSISVRAIEGLVQKCVDKHNELHVTSTSLDSSRDGLIIKLRIGLASGVNIPLAVGALQKQIKQYITACSGVDVKEVKVQVETAVSGVTDSPYAVPDMLQNASPLPKEEIKPIEVPAPELEEKKPLHQRLFGSEEQPAIVPAPPEAPAANEPAEAEAAQEPSEPVEAVSAEAEGAAAEDEAADEEKAGTEEAVSEEAGELPEDEVEEEKHEIAE